MSHIAPRLLIALCILCTLSGDRDSMPPMVGSAEIANQYYAHGAFMAAAADFWNDFRWNKILESLLPDVYADVAKRVAKGGGDLMSRVIPMFENNPVIAAYGLLKTKAMDEADRNLRRSPSRLTRMRGFEWDCFFDPDLVRAWKREGDASEDKARIVDGIVDTMLIAHGTGLQLAQELVNIHQYRKVLDNRMTAMGGANARDWMNLFAKALVLGGNDKLPIEERSKILQERYSFQQAVAIYRGQVGEAIFQEVPFSVILDVKTTKVKGSYMPELLDDVIMSLNKRGIRVEAVGTFYFKSLPKLNGDLAYKQVLTVGDGEITSSPVARIKFFHYVGDLQKRSHEGDVATSDTVMLNACSLLDSKRVEGGYSYKLDEHTLGSLAIYQRRFDLSIGLYVQDGDIEAESYTLLAGAVNDNPDIFRLGFAWGGVNGRVHSKSSSRKAKGCGTQGLVGHNWLDNGDDRALLSAWLAAITKDDKNNMKIALAMMTGKQSITGFDDTGENWDIHSKRGGLGKFPNLEIAALKIPEGLRFTAFERSSTNSMSKSDFSQDVTLSDIPPYDTCWTRSQCAHAISA